MSIARFFEGVLGAKLRNVRWSWGATDPTGRVFLRVWDDQVVNDEQGRYILVARNPTPSSKPGSRERHEHIAALRAGAEGFGVVCHAVDPQARPRTIEAFKKDILFRLGPLRDTEDGILALVVDEVNTTELATGRATPTSITPDTEAVGRDLSVDETTRQALVQARLGQGRFRADVLRAWDGQCAVTGSGVLAAIRASHIRPWRHSTNEQRLDPDNGLPLVANLDALFDAGMITFDAGGKLLVSPVMSPGESELFGLQGLALRRPPSSAAREYLAYHRATIFLD